MSLSNPNFDFRRIPGLVLWLDGSDSSTVTVATGASAWYDKSGSGLVATQATGANQPTYGSPVFNGRKALYFDGTNDDMVIAANSALNLTACTIMVVFYADELRNAGVISKIGTNITPDGFGIYTRSGGQTWFQGDSNDAQHVALSGFTATTLSLTTARGDNTHQTLRTNGSVGTTRNGTAIFTANLATRIGTRTSGSEYFKGYICEILIWNRMLTPREERVARYALVDRWDVTSSERTSPITNAPRVLNPDAQNWVDRVYVNSGTVSQACANAHNTFCDGIDAGGLRAYMYRFSFLTGTQLTAGLTPLYRGPAYGGTTYGNITDTNVNFVSGDFNEVGSSSGFKGNRTSKYLRTGLLNTVWANTNQMAYGYGYRTAASTDANEQFLGNVYDATSNVGSQAICIPANRWSGGFGQPHISSNNAGDLVSPGALAVGDIISTWPKFYRNGVVSGQTATVSQVPVGNYEFPLFCMNNQGSFMLGSDSRLNWYFFGAVMSEAQAQALTTLIQAFNTTMGRT